MPSLNWIRLATRIEELLNERLGGDEDRHASFLGALCHLIVTAGADDESGAFLMRSRIPGLIKLLDDLMAALVAESNVHKALCARYLYRQSEAKARRRWKVRDSEWNYIHKLARRCSCDFDLIYGIFEELFLDADWHDELEEQFTQREVILETKAIEDLLIPVMEGYLRTRKVGGKYKAYEVYGICLGMRSVREAGKGRGPRSNSLVNIMRCQPQLSAHSKSTWVIRSERSIKALMQATQSLFPAYELIGEFHSHAYDTLSDLETNRGWEFSEGDEGDLVYWARDMKDKLGQKPAVSLVAAIASCERNAERRHHNGIKSTLELSAGGCRIIINAYRVLGSGRPSNQNVILKAPGMIE
ncbi:MAG TPA: hypothetical protein VM658_19280 [bacterium]|nr:hypothetical protein [bacterium]